VAPEALVPPNLVGLFASIIGMLMGSLAPQLVGNRGHSIAQALQPHGRHGAG
jgi:solute:Na+ symporter, SSS family